MQQGLAFWTFSFILGYVIIYFATDYLLDMLKEFSELHRLSPVFVGIFILGVDLEESIVSIVSAFEGLPYLSIGNIIGNSIIAIAISFGLPSLYLKFAYTPVPRLYLIFLGLASLSILFSTIYPTLLVVFAVINIFLFLGYIVYTSYIQMQYDTDAEQEAQFKNYLLLYIFGLLVILFLGGELLVKSASQLIMLSDLSETFFGLVITAFVTNVEEFWLIVKSIQKEQTQMGISAEIGKILWNTTFIFGLSSLIIGSYRADTLLLTNAVLLFLFLLLLIFHLVRNSFSRKTGVIYLAILIGFLGNNIGMIM